MTIIMIAPADKPLMTALQKSALIGLTCKQVYHQGEKSDCGDRPVERGGTLLFLRKTARPASYFGQGVTQRPREHRDGQQPCADYNYAKKEKRVLPRQAAGVPRPPGLRFQSASSHQACNKAPVSTTMK
jgi:hypothetical protein